MKNKLHKMQLGRRAAYLRRCVMAADLLAQHETDISVRRRVFDKYIQPQLRCSYTTFNNMLNEPNPHNQLEAIEAEINALSNI